MKTTVNQHFEALSRRIGEVTMDQLVELLLDWDANTGDVDDVIKRVKGQREE